MTERVSLIVAHDMERAIGFGGIMPWHIPADLKHFKRVTMGKPVIMGRKTFDSIGRALPGRPNLVISRGQPDLPEGVALFSSLADACASVQGFEEIMVIGGAQIYTEALERAHRLYVTEIQMVAPEADTYFPAYRQLGWSVVEETHIPATNDQPALTFKTLDRSPA